MSLRLNLLIVDDDPLVAQAISLVLPSQWQMRTHSKPTEFPSQGLHAAFVDMHLTGDLGRTEGLEVIRQLHRQHPHLQIVAMSGDLSRELMEAALAAGASRFLAKPLNPEEFRLNLEKIEALLLLLGALSRGPRDDGWIGNSTASRTVLTQMAQLKGEKGPILISGPTGSGKEVVARLLHLQENLPRPFVALNAAAIAENLFESEMFGHTKEAFTGADQNKMGLAEAAADGDLFIDEIEAMPLSQQAKLLRFLETGEVRRVGANQAVRVETRVISATNVSLETLVKDGKFREDLLWRIKGRHLEVPPLRSRLDDLEALARHFLSQHSTHTKSLAPDALAVLQEYSWPGNVRELKRVCEQLLLLAPLPLVRAQDVRNVLPKQIEVPGMGLSPKADLSKGMTSLLNDFEASILKQALSQVADVDEAARLLGVSRSTFYKKLKDHHIEWRPS